MGRYCSRKWNQPFCAKNLHFKADGCRSPGNYVAQFSGHKNLKSLDSYKTASDDHQCKMSLLLSSGTKFPISSNDAPLNQAVKASQHPFKPRKDKQASSGEDP